MNKSTGATKVGIVGWKHKGIKGGPGSIFYFFYFLFSLFISFVSAHPIHTQYLADDVQWLKGLETELEKHGKYRCYSSAGNCLDLYLRVGPYRCHVVKGLGLARLTPYPTLIYQN